MTNFALLTSISSLTSTAIYSCSNLFSDEAGKRLRKTRENVCVRVSSFRTGLEARHSQTLGSAVTSGLSSNFPVTWDKFLNWW